MVDGISCLVEACHSVWRRDEDCGRRTDGSNRDVGACACVQRGPPVDDMEQDQQALGCLHADAGLRTQSERGLLQACALI